MRHETMMRIFERIRYIQEKLESPPRISHPSLKGLSQAIICYMEEELEFLKSIYEAEKDSNEKEEK